MVVKTEIPAIPVKDLLKQVQAAAEIQAAKFTQPVDNEKSPVSGATVGKNIEGKGKKIRKKEGEGFSMRRRKGKGEKLQPKSAAGVPKPESKQEAAAALLPQNVAQEIVSGGGADIDMSDMRNPYGDRVRTGDEDPINKTQREMDELGLARSGLSDNVVSTTESTAPVSGSPAEGGSTEKSAEVMEIYRKIDELGGLQGRYKVSGSSGADDGWEIAEMDFDTGLMDLKKSVDDQAHQKMLFEYGVSIDELMEWNKPSAIAVPEVPVLTDAVVERDIKEEEQESSRESQAEIISGESKKSLLDQEIVRLKNEAEGLRAAYAKADYDETNAWARVRKFFGKTIAGLDEREWQKKQYNNEQSYHDGVYWQAQYQNVLVDLKNAQLDRIKNNASDGIGWKQEMADMIRYFDLDEVTNLIDARTQYRAEKQNLPTKIFDTIGVVGRWYNRIPLKNKMYVTAALAGVTIASVASGGLAAGAMATALVGVRRFASGAGMAVGTEALLDSSRTKYQASETEEEIDRLFAETPEKGFDYLEAEMQKKAFAVDDRLQKAKLTKLLHKTGALTIGVAVGSGWLSQIVMDKMGGGEAIDWVKEQFHGNGGDVSVSSVVPPSGTIETPDVPSDELPHEVPEESDFPIEDGDAGATEQIPTSPSESGVEAEIMESDSIDTFINQDIVVQKGDSVWKIAGRLAQEFGLEEKSPQGTRFINALKDQYGDVLLKEGDLINFAEHGIDKEFIENALEDANTLSPEQIASIADNDAKIAEFAQDNPDVTLTNETTDTIVQDMASLPGTDIGQATTGVEMTESTESTDALSEESDNASSVAEESTEKEEFRGADINLERDVVLGKEYSLKNYTEYFRQNPEEFTKFKNLGDQYFAYIFPGNPDDMKTIGSMKISDFHSDSNGATTDLHQFMKMAKETYGGKLGLPGPKEKVYEYVARMAMLGIEHPTGKRIIFPQYV